LGNDSISAAKVVSEYAKKNDKFVIRTAYIDGEASDAAKVEAFAKLPGREELLGMLAATWMGPVQYFTIGLNALKEKLEAEAS
jgi:large subunit ribosomal protein L10